MNDRPFKVWENTTWRSEKKNELFNLQETIIPFSQKLYSYKRFRLLFKEKWQIAASDSKDEISKIWDKITKEVKEFLQTKQMTEADEDAIVQFIADLPLSDSWTSIPRENYVAKKHVPQFQIIEDYDGKAEKTFDDQKMLDTALNQPISSSPINGLFMSLKFSYNLSNQAQFEKEGEDVSFEENLQRLSESQSPSSSFQQSVEKESTLLKKIVKLWPEETVISIHDCEIRKVTSVPGKLVITKNSLCFVDSLPSLSPDLMLGAYLDKKGKLKWNRYYVKISNMGVQYFLEAKNFHEPKKTLASHLITAVEIVVDGDSSKPDKFLVRTKDDGDHIFAVDNPIQLQKWVESIRKVAEKAGNCFRIPFLNIKDFGKTPEYISFAVVVQNDPVTYMFTSVANYNQAMENLETQLEIARKDGVAKLFTEEKSAAEKHFTSLYPSLKEEKLEAYYGCSLFRTLLPVPGYMYITKRHVCFHCISVWQNYKIVQVVLHMSEITQVEVDKMYSLWISTQDGDKFQFINCWKNVECKALIESFMSVDLTKSIESSSLDGTISELPQAPKWNPGAKIVFLTIGSRGDVQPYLSLAKRLKQEGYKIKIVTHAIFESFIKEVDSDFEFGVIGGDPRELMDLCVRNGIFTPSFVKEALGKFTGFIDEVLENSLKECEGADMIISPPIVMSAFHVAEKLKVPLFNTFTMPFTKTSYYPHPFMIPDKPLGSVYNSISYSLMQSVFWLPMQGQINSWRANHGLVPISGDFMHSKKIPFLYCFSKYLIPKPPDWGDEIKVSGFWFIDQGSKTTYQPPKELADFMDKNDPRPLIYVGFGSIVVADPDGLTSMVFSALKTANVRAILVKGWGGLGKGIEIPENVFQINAIPHEWLFPQTAAVVHHGGAGTSAIGLRSGKPTIVVPFFGDQYFWGQRVAELGVGTYINNKNLTVNNLADAIKYCTTNSSVLANAKKLGEQIMKENGIEEALKTIYTYAPCAYIPSAPQPLESASKCKSCLQSLSKIRKLNCTSCGSVFCDKCCLHKIRIEKFLIRTPVFVCDNCYNQLK